MTLDRVEFLKKSEEYFDAKEHSLDNEKCFEKYITISKEMEMIIKQSSIEIFELLLKKGINNL